MPNNALNKLNVTGSDCRKRFYISPKRIMRTTGNIHNTDALLKGRPSQITLETHDTCVMKNDSEKHASVLLDFGREICGSVRLCVGRINGGDAHANIRVRFGESAMEALAPLGEDGTTIDHAVRDMDLRVGWLSANETNESGFRFVYVELLDESSTLELKYVEGILICRDIEYSGEFECSDPLLTEIWNTAVYTTHLNMQEFLWDGVKRDRLVWVGDMLTEVRTIIAAFGFDEVVPKSLDFIRDATDVDGWMNGMPSYSLWWILIQYRLYMQTGDLGYLESQRAYIESLAKRLEKYVLDDGAECLPEPRFLDHYNGGNPPAIHAGLHGLMIMTLDAAAYLCDVLGDSDAAGSCRDCAAKMRGYLPPLTESKQAESMTVCAGLRDPKQTVDELLNRDGAKNFSAFLSLHTLEAFAKAGKIVEALSCIRQYWGGMLSLGATSFWEEFDVDWLPGAGRIDELVPSDKIDVHRTYGKGCYTKYRNSFCHGWASTPAPWLTEHILGVEILEPGCKKLKIAPSLGSLEWVRGKYPTPHGIVAISHEKQPDGSVKTTVEAPAGVEIVK